MKSINGLFLLSLLLTGILACKKDKDLTKTDIITQKPWKLTAKTVSPAIVYPDFGSISDFYALYYDCVKDDIWVLKVTGTYTMEEGATKCAPTDPTIWDMGTWSFNSDETILTTSGSIYSLREYDILELTTSVMKLRYQLYDTLENIYTFSESYGH